MNAIQRTDLTQKVCIRIRNSRSHHFLPEKLRESLRTTKSGYETQWHGLRNRVLVRLAQESQP
jgi:hypothetical protein